MVKTNRFIVLILSLLMLLSVAGCAKQAATPPAAAPETLTVSAAASLKTAMDEIKANYATEKPNITLSINYGGSGALETQIEQGAPVDVFMSAATKQVDMLKAKGLILEGTDKNLLGNQLVLVVPSNSTADLKDFQGVATNAAIKKLALGEPKTVPAGQYGTEVFTKLNILDSVTPKIVYAKDVTEVLNWVATGNADAGVVYMTDAKTTDKVKVIATAAEDSHTPIVYPAAVIKASAHEDSAKAFLSYLSSDKAKAVFEKYGFTVIAK
jgi:molybdate transport system substrate-binding protein